MAQMTQEEHKEFRDMRIVCASGINPDNKELIKWPMRACSIIPTKAPIIAGMLITAPVPQNIIFWQWLNQTYNAGLNYGNRNASSKQTGTDLLKAYCVATSSATVIALSMRKAADLVLAGKTGLLVAFSVNLINYCAVTIATSTNVGVMRMKELETGVTVKDEKGNSYGMSQEAAHEGIFSCIKSRAAFNIPIFFAPFFWNQAFRSLNLMPKSKTPAGLLVEFGGVAFGLYLAMPINCALYPQTMKIDVNRLEPAIRDKAKADGLTHLQYNKGL